MAAMDTRIPVTIITGNIAVQTLIHFILTYFQHTFAGFLGSGKTTLINHILTEQHGMKIAIIENEFGDVGVDDGLLKQNKKFQTDEEVIEMLNGCICCTVRQDLVSAIKKMFITKKLKVDAVIIETTGLADPAPVAQTFFVDEDVTKICRLDAIITVVDAKHILQRLREEKPEGVENESVEQVAFADRILLNKCDLATEEERAEIKKVIHGINSTAKIMETTHSVIHPKELLNIEGFSLDAILTKEPEFLDTDGEHEHDTSVTSIAFNHPDPMNIGKLQNWISDMMQTKGNDLFRYKGIINVQGFPKKFVFQGVHMLFDGNFTEDWKDGETRESKFVFIGKNLDKEELTSKFLDCRVSAELRFAVGTKVFARLRGGDFPDAYDKGTIIAQWDEGNPYRIKLDSGTEVWGPDDEDTYVRAQ